MVGRASLRGACICSAPCIATGRAMTSKAPVAVAVLLCCHLALGKVATKVPLSSSTVLLMPMKTSGALHRRVSIGSSRGKKCKRKQDLGARKSLLIWEGALVLLIMGR